MPNSTREESSLAIRGGFYDSIGGDRIYTSEDFNHLFDGVIAREGVAPADPPIKLTASSNTVIISEVSGRVNGKWFTIDSEGYVVYVDPGKIIDVYVMSDQTRRSVHVHTVNNTFPHDAPPAKLPNAVLLARIPRPLGAGIDSSLFVTYPGTDLSPFMAYKAAPPSYNQIRDEIGRNKANFNTVIVEGKPPSYAQIKSLLTTNKADFNNSVVIPYQLEYGDIVTAITPYKRLFNQNIVDFPPITYAAVKGVIEKNKADFNSSIVTGGGGGGTPAEVTYETIKSLLTTNKADFNANVVDAKPLVYSEIKSLLTTNKADFNANVVDSKPLVYSEIKALLNTNKADFNSSIVTPPTYLQLTDAIGSSWRGFLARGVRNTNVGASSLFPTTPEDKRKNDITIGLSEELGKYGMTANWERSGGIPANHNPLRGVLKDGRFNNFSLGSTIETANKWKFTVVDYDAKRYDEKHTAVLWVGSHLTDGYVPSVFEARLTKAGVAFSDQTPIRQKMADLEQTVVDQLQQLGLEAINIPSDVFYNGESQWYGGGGHLIPGFAINFFGPNYMVDPPYLTNFGGIYKYFRYFQTNPLDWAPGNLVTQQMSRGAYCGVGPNGLPNLIWRGDTDESSLLARPLMYVVVKPT